MSDVIITLSTLYQQHSQKLPVVLSFLNAWNITWCQKLKARSLTQGSLGYRKHADSHKAVSRKARQKWQLNKASRTQVIMQVVIKASNLVIMVEEKQITWSTMPHTMPRLGNLVLRPPMFDLKVAKKYQELSDFKMEVKNIS